MAHRAGVTARAGARPPSALLSAPTTGAMPSTPLIPRPPRPPPSLSGDRHSGTSRNAPSPAGWARFHVGTGVQARTTPRR